ncbi:MAG: hypothetical protein NC191_00745 [Muribaculaceae bacterium]|nr:hypothetical protein [Muribaculaceae bacterium]
MSFISKITSRYTPASAPVEQAVQRAKRLPNRFLNGCFQTMGPVTRAPRQNTSAEILESISAYADVYEAGAKSAEPKLIELAKEYGVNLPKEAKRLGVDIFEAAKRKGRVEHDFKYTDFRGEEKVERRAVDLAAVSEDVRHQKLVGETNSRELRNFLAQTDGMSTEHLGVAHDIIDLAHMRAMLNTNIDFQDIIPNGRTLMGEILSRFPEVSRKNPGAIELTGKVFNHSDDTNSKYFVNSLFGNDLPNKAHLSEYFKALKGMVPTFAKEALSGGYLMDYSKENKFFQMIADFCRPEVKPESIKLLPDVMPKISEMIASISKKTHPVVDRVSIATGDAGRITENVDVLPQVLGNFEAAGKNLDVSEFITKNVNLG